MKKFCISLFLCLITVQCHADQLEKESRVTKALVYRDSAQVTRQVEVSVEEGVHEIVISNVPENLNEHTLTVSARGTAQAMILDSKIKSIYLEEPESEKVRELERKIQDREDSLLALNNERAILQEEKEYLKSIKLHTAGQIPEDLVTKTPTVGELGALGDFLKGKWEAVYERELQINIEQRKIRKTLTRLKRELAELYQARRKDKRIISIELNVKRKGLLTVEASYLMYQASWYPEYDARVNYENGSVALSCIGVVRQTSGDDWKGAELVLTTGKPTVSGRMPELSSWTLRPQPPARPLERQHLMRASVMAKSDAFMSDAEIDESRVEGAPQQEEAKELLYQAERLAADVDEKLTSVNYRIARKVDIKSDGTRHRIPVFTSDFKANFQFSATPKLSTQAYLLAKVINDEEQLLPAAVRIYFDDVYVGSSRVDAIGKGEEFDLYLGLDEGVKVKREKLQEETKEVWIAGIKRNNKVVILSYKVTVENYKDRDIHIDIFDQMPVSANDQIVVKQLTMDPKPAEENYKDRKGVMRWALDMKPGEKEEIVIMYQVEFPRDMNVL